MRVGGYYFSSWWLLVAIPLALLMLPLILIGFLAANNFVGAILSRSDLEDRPSHRLTVEELAGIYRGPEQRGTGQMSRRPYLELKPNGNAVVIDLPWAMAGRSCVITGSGEWKLSGSETPQISLTVKSKSTTRNVCDAGMYADFEVKGDAKPYSLRCRFGDPDGGGMLVWLYQN